MGRVQRKGNRNVYNLKLHFKKSLAFLCINNQKYNERKDPCIQVQQKQMK